jgi:hypothetical protein
MSPLAETTSLIQGLIDSWPRLARFFVATFLAFPFIIAGWDKGVQIGWIPDERERLMSEIVMQHQTQIQAQASQTRILESSQRMLSTNQRGIEANQKVIIDTGERTFQAMVANCFIGAKDREDHQRCETLNRTGKGD